MCVQYWSFLWRPQWRRLDSMCEMFQTPAHTLCWYGGRVCLWALSGINIVLFLVSFVFVFCSISVIIFYFLLNYSPPQIRRTHLPILGTRMRLIWGDEAFTETNFTQLFIFILCSNCLFINQIKLFLCFGKFYNIFLSLIAVLKKPSHIRRLSPTLSEYLKEIFLHIWRFYIRYLTNVCLEFSTDTLPSDTAPTSLSAHEFL
jgi:hypothetical protein